MAKPLPRSWKLPGALASANYRTFTIGNAISLVGSWTQRVAAGWLAWELTGSPTWLGLIAFADLFPTLVLGPLAGAVADRHDRLDMVRVCQWLAMAQSLVLLGLALAGWIDIRALFALSLVLGIIQSFDQPARLALVGSLVERADLPSAVAINSISFNLARFAGPALAGICIVTGGVSYAFLLNGLSFAACIIMLGHVHVLRATPAPSVSRLTDDLAAGVRYTFLNPGFVIALGLVTAINVCARPVLELLPAFAVELYGADAAGFATLAAAMGFGATLGGLWMAIKGKSLRLSMFAIISACVIVAALVALVLLSSLLPATLAMAVLGFFLATSGIAIQSLVQLAAEESMRGRVLSIYGLLFRAGPAVGGLAMGALGEALGLRMPTVLAALLIAAAALWAFMRRKILVETVESRLAQR